MNLEELPFDILELIGKKLHKLYEEWRKENNLGDAFDEDYYPSTEEDSD